MDWNNDGALDLITGEQDGHVRIYLRNGNNLGAYSYVRVNSSNWTAPGGFTKPEVVDWNNDGKKDLVVGDGNGRIHLLRNTGTDAAPTFGSPTTLYTGSSGDRMAPVVYDFDNDGKKDLLFGETYGRLYFCRNTGTDSAPVLAAPAIVTLQSGAQLNVGYYSRPTVADWNGDGLKDLIVGADDGRVYFFAQISTNAAPTALALSANTVAESQPAGTTVGTFSTTDPNAGNTFTYTLVSGTGSTNNSSFTIDGNTLKTAASFNFEIKNSYSIRVRTTDQGGLWVEQAFTITVTNLPAGPLALTTTDAANIISIRLSGARYQVTIDGTDSYYDLEEVTTISILGQGGNDTITIGPGVPGCSIKGGAGNDTIYGGLGADTIYGDDGNDRIEGGDGNDSLNGNWGDDILLGGAGTDVITAGLGADSIRGGQDGDSLYAGDHCDTIWGDDGHDYIEARGKADTVYGGAGNDTIWGGAGSDSISGDDGNDWIDIGYLSFVDTIDGGTGTDTVQCCTGDINDNVLGVELFLNV